MKNKLVLASASPRRRDLLAQAGLSDFIVAPASVDESPLKNELPGPLAERLARLKCEAAARAHPDAFVLGADTVVACGRRILGKAESEEEARRFLKLLSGRRHRVLGGIAVQSPQGKIRSALAETMVQFRRLGDADIDDYVAGGEWKDKAGAYAIQGRAECYIKSMRGSYSNVVGLSLYDTMRLLQGAGFHPNRTAS